MTHRIVVLGAGYAGLNTAVRAACLLHRHDARVTLVNRSDRFIERIRLHQLAAGQELSDRPLARLLDGSGVELVVGTVTELDPAGRRVRVDGPARLLGYDTLVYALGSGADLDAVPGVREHAYSLAEPDRARRLRDRLRELPAGAVVVVVGGGLTGIEAATELAEAYPRLRVEMTTAAPVGGWLSPRARRHLRGSLDRLGVAVREGRIAKVGARELLFDDGSRTDADLIVWAAGFRVPALAAEAGLAVDTVGRMIVDDRLRSISHPDVYGVGDAAAAPTPGGTETRMSCQTAMQMAPYVAQEITRTLRGRPSKPVAIRYIWQNISLGRHDGVTQFTRADDSPRGAVLTGRASARFKELISRSAVWLVRR
ncbi:NAD(P)/FAD-dependent oxidoreductase [Nocardia transvalensis]|uniref:NAD(P)/FAD-dependent oxidoreductase n=1 Tax=Nocardia transvalensis TaxID=37333 RepID=UPI0018945043|nr:FAD-dependent oxidoreductase [Nocardia transvalensis]MBF6327727.1 FAD-dependent oxidoreductase [Nocardia transvalensis]